MQEIGLRKVIEDVVEALRAGRLDTAGALLWPALDQFPDLPQLWFCAGNLWHLQGMAVPARMAYQRAFEQDYNPLVLTNVGACYRRLNDFERGIRVLERAVELSPENSDAYINLGGMYVNEGNPGPGIAALGRARELLASRGLPTQSADWNLALLELEAGNFERGFELYTNAGNEQRLHREYQMNPDPPRYRLGDERPGKVLLVYGEQGIGDELMFGSILEEARADFDQVIFDCHPRLEHLHRGAHPGMTIFPTRKDRSPPAWPKELARRPDYIMPIGDLGHLYRRDLADFDRAWQARGPFYSVDSGEVAAYRDRLKTLAQGRPIVALATRGGTLSTSRHYRSLDFGAISALLAGTDAMFVSLDYEDMMPTHEALLAKHGAGRFMMFPAVTQAWDYHHHGALAAACDLVVTVNQSIAHLTAAMGLNVRVLTPKRVAWRYGLDSPGWYWYPSPSVRLYRQEAAGDWAPAVGRVIEDIRGLAS